MSQVLEFFLSLVPISCNWQVRSLRYLSDIQGTGAIDVYIVHSTGNKADPVELPVPKGASIRK